MLFLSDFEDYCSNEQFTKLASSLLNIFLFYSEKWSNNPKLPQESCSASVFAVMLLKNSSHYTTTFPYQVVLELLEVMYFVQSSFLAACLASSSGSIK
jgi:hypothetical protein